MPGSCVRFVLLLAALGTLRQAVVAQSLEAPPAANLQALAREFYSWRNATQPTGYDDVNRVERPEAWVPAFSAMALQRQREEYQSFQARLHQLERAGWTTSDSVDYLVLRGAIARVRYELDLLRAPHCNPDFYVQQTLGTVYELLLPPPPFRETRARDLIVRLQAIPQTLRHARENLTESVGPFADLALENLAGVRHRLERVVSGVTPLLAAKMRKPLAEAARRAAAALEDYAVWLVRQRPGMRDDFAVGAEVYDWYLCTIALMPYNRAELLLLARQEWDRAVAWDHFESQRNAGLPQPDLFATSADQIAACRQQEQEIRDFLQRHQILEVPAWMGHYGNLKMPDYIEALSHLGVVDDLTSPSRLGENGVSYIPEPAPTLSFFRRACAQDPRPIIIHEGTPGHYFQLCLSWAHPNLIRRHYVDSGPIEGIGFYAEELMQQFGLFDQAPRTREIIHRFMRLRALRVEVDIKLATGEFTIADAARYLAETVPMDVKTAEDEAVFFATNPGQAISYQIGKTQVLHFLAAAKLKLGPAFSLRAFHNYLWQNGNVPIALLQWEYLGNGDVARALFQP